MVALTQGIETTNPPRCPGVSDLRGAREARHPLFRLVAALVARDAGPAGLDGSICIGIRAPEGDVWWRVSMGARMVAEPRDAPDPGARASLLLESEAAIEMLRTGRFPPGAGAWLEGDAGFVLRWIERLTSRTSWLGIRSQACTPSRRLRRRS